jgi:glycerophosphoryl diester phosphodiesterase
MKHRSLAFVALVSTLAVLGAGHRAAPAPLDVRLFAHRGYTREAPENSIAALRAAVALGLAGSEIDLRTTRDGVVVLMHDATVDRTTTGSGPVAAMTWTDLRRLRLKAADGRITGESVPELSAVLRFAAEHPGFSLVFDAKEVDLAAVGRRVLAAGLQDRITFFVGDPLAVDRVRAVKQVDPRLRISVDLLGWWKIEGLPTFARRALDADALFASEFFFPRFGFREAKEAGAEVQVYLYGSTGLPERLARAAQLGADVASSDHPELLVSLVRRRAAAPVAH